MESHYEPTIAQINEHLDYLAEQGQPWIEKWIAHAVCEKHRKALPYSADADFWLWNGYQSVRELVRRVIGKRAGLKPTKDRDKQQIDLPGFERVRLQDYYVVVRDGVEQGVPVVSLSDAEIDEKAGELRAMGAGLYAHADELERFKTWRREAA